MKTRILILKWIDSIFGRAAVILLSYLMTDKATFQRKKFKVSEYARFLIIRPGGIGDAVLLFPALNELRKSFLHSQIHVLAEKRNAGIFEICKSIDKLYLYDSLSDLISVLRNRYDAVIDTEQWHRLSAVVSYLTRANVRVGFSTNERKKLFTTIIEYSHNDYEVDSFLKLFSVVLNPLSPPFNKGRMGGFDPEKPFIDISTRNSKLGTQNSKLTVAISSEASIKEREWGIKKFSELVERLIQKGAEIVVIGKRKINGFNGKGMKNLTGELNLFETVKEISKVSLLVTVDSGIMHIAYGLGTPTVSLFGPGIENKWAPKGKNHITINKRPFCSPCTKYGYTPSCPRDAECMRLISVDEVEDAVLKLISKQKN